MRRSSALLAMMLLVLAGATSAQLPVPGPSPATPDAAPAAVPTPAPEGDGEPVADSAWEHVMQRYYKIWKFPKELVIRLGPNVGYPAQFMRTKMEIVDEDAEFVYMRNLPIEDPDSMSHRAWAMRQSLEIRELARQEEADGQFIMDPAVEHALPAFSDRIHLVERSEGLPDQGRWGMGVDFADMNGDGLIDIVLPPVRLGYPYPVIILQTPTGWRAWDVVKWPTLKLDYGDVKVADFDKDGHLDIAIACHFLRNYVLYGNGKGDFTRYVELPRISDRISSRAVAKADFDGDGRTDLVFLAELDVDLATNARHVGGLVQVLLNTEKGWKAVPVDGGDEDIYGDRVAVGDFNADGRPDVFVSSHKNSNLHLMFLNRDGSSFRPVASREFPSRGYVFGVAAGNIDGKPGDEALIGAMQNVRAGSAQHPMNGVVVYKLVGEGEEMTVQRTVVAVEERDTDAYVAAAVLDVDGDGRNDLVVGRRGGTVEIYLQGLDGQFFREHSPELQLGDPYINAFGVVPIGSKGERALVVVSADGPTTPGSVRAFVVRRGPLPLTKPQTPR